MTARGPERFAQWWSSEDLRELPLLLRHAHHEIDNTVASLMETAGWPRLSMSAMLTLREIGPRGRALSQLPGALRISRQAVTTVVRDLERHDLVSSGPSWPGGPYSPGGHVVGLTERGRDARVALDRALDELVADLGDALPDDMMARTVLTLRMAVYRDTDEWLRLLGVATSLGVVSPRQP